MKNQRNSETIYFKFDWEGIEQFEGFSIHPCIVVGWENGKDIVERCSKDDAAFWTVYFKLSDGREMAIADFCAENYADSFVKFLQQVVVFAPKNEKNDGKDLVVVELSEGCVQSIQSNITGVCVHIVDHDILEELDNNDADGILRQINQAPVKMVSFQELDEQLSEVRDKYLKYDDDGFGGYIDEVYSLIQTPINNVREAKLFLIGMAEHGALFPLDKYPGDIIRGETDKPLFKVDMVKDVCRRVEEVRNQEFDPFEFINRLNKLAE